MHQEAADRLRSRLYANVIPDQDDVVVERLKNAEAIAIGTTNVPEFGYSGVGKRNLWDTSKTSGPAFPPHPLRPEVFPAIDPAAGGAGDGSRVRRSAPGGVLGARHRNRATGW